MRVLKSKPFSKWAAKEGISDGALVKAALIEVNEDEEKNPGRSA
jgi:hypothetical protein